MKNKSIGAIAFLLIAAMFAIPSFSEEPTIDCCINVHPNVPEELVCKEGVPKATCCSEDTVGEGDPADIQACEADYWNAGGCEVFTEGQCDLGCCCKEGSELDADRIPRILCTEKKDGIFTETEDPSQTCTQVCSGVTTECGNDV